MDVDVVLLTGLDRFASVIEKVGPDDWDKQSPCVEWSARALTGHVLSVLDSAAMMMNGGTFDRSSVTDLAAFAGDDPLTAFEQRSAAARAALKGAQLDEVMETPMGPMPVRGRLAFPAMDLHVHAWDLGRAIGVPVEIPIDVADFARAAIDPLPQERVRSGGVFGAEVPAPADATVTEALVAWTGRQPR